MRTNADHKLRDLIDQETKAIFTDERSELRAKAKAHISKIQDENKKYYNLRRKQARSYSVDDLVAIKRTQFGSGLKLKPKYFGPYQVKKVKHNNAYDVEKVGKCEGPKVTSTCAEYMKPWSPNRDDEEDDPAFGSNA
ncbi:uncharacterized protein LOC124461407 [Drosophila willistoni]|uniref:uncharacterized protein LOC124461407 n=1 Tax=Drosophila willistoni TaxID=7260 RepID=UPI001F07DEBE|nr:uncharacterized protein LOC124461407 [Drosophila willistoni]